MSKDDAVVERVRNARKQIIERCGGDKRRLREWVKQIEAAQQDRVVALEVPKRKSGKAGDR